MDKWSMAQDINQVVYKPSILPPLWNTNADSLCNYMRDIDYLRNKLEKKALIPRYVVENVKYLGIKELWKIEFPMVCFCDIPFSKIRMHIDKYGGYGLAFYKTRLLKKYGLQPIHYITDKSPLKRDFREAFQHSMDNEVDEKHTSLIDYILTTLVFMKPVLEVKIEEGEEKTTIFQNECEWRYVPDTSLIPPDMEFILKNEDATKKSGDLYSLALEKHHESWLKFEWDDVKYIIVQSEKDSVEIIEFIRSLDIDELDKNSLISKIEVIERFLEDV